MTKLSSRISRLTFGALVILGSSIALVACGGSSGSSDSSGSTSSGSTSGSGSGSTSTTTPQNTLAVTLDNGPTGNAFDTPYVTVTVCKPGTTTCATIDHVLLDTGSYGLRLMQSSALTALSLPTVKTPSGAAAGECAQFVSGFTWGSVRQADVKLAGETASNIPMEIIGDTTSAYANVPSECASAGADLSSVSAMNANGIIGVGLMAQDCGPTCASDVVGYYYGCSASGCVDSVMPLTSQVGNPVSSFTKDNNGVILTLPSVAIDGATTLTGSLTFGLGTETNNAVPGKVYKADENANFVTTYEGTEFSESFLDSGSNAVYLPFEGTMACTTDTGFLCPTDITTISATNASYDGSNSGTVSFTFVSVETLADDVYVAAIAAEASDTSGSVDWGLPFFFGRSIAVAIDGQSTPAGTGPFWAY